MSEKRFYIVFNSRGDDGKIHGAHIVSSNVSSIQDLLETTWDPVKHAIGGDTILTTRYLLREKAGGEDDDPNSKAWANYEIDPTDEATPYATFEEAEAALNAEPPPPEENL